MSTSGTVGKTTVSTDVLLEHALRRCGKTAAEQTSEVVDIAKSCLYIMLAHYANNGLNLWCVERRLLGLQAYKKEYKLPTGVVDVLSISYATPTVLQAATVGNTAALSATSTVTRVGMSFSVLPAGDFTIDTSTDGVVFVTQKTVDADYYEVTSVGVTYWFMLDPAVVCKHVRVSGGTVSELLCASVTHEIDIQQENRDTYASLPNKDQTSSTVTSYLFNKTLAPSVTLWPVPVDHTRHLAMDIHRQIQDVGRLTQTLAVPERWLEATIIQLAFRLSMELPKVDPARITLLAQLAQQFTIAAGYQETDSSTSYISPDIGCYNA